MMRAPSAIGSLCRTGCFPPGDAAENGTDGHTQSAQVTLSQNVARHDLAGGENIRAEAAVHADGRRFIDLDAQVGEGKAGTQGVAAEGRRVDGLRPMRFRRNQSSGAAIIEREVTESAGHNRLVELADGLFEAAGR